MWRAIPVVFEGGQFWYRKSSGQNLLQRSANKMFHVWNERSLPGIDLVGCLSSKQTPKAGRVSWSTWLLKEKNLCKLLRKPNQSSFSHFCTLHRGSPFSLSFVINLTIFLPLVICIRYLLDDNVSAIKDEDVTGGWWGSCLPSPVQPSNGHECA